MDKDNLNKLNYNKPFKNINNFEYLYSNNKYNNLKKIISKSYKVHNNYYNVSFIKFPNEIDDSKIKNSNTLYSIKNKMNIEKSFQNKSIKKLFVGLCAYSALNMLNYLWINYYSEKTKILKYESLKQSNLLLTIYVTHNIKLIL